MSDTNKTAVENVTEEDLRKSLAQLEGKKEEEKKPAEPVVVTTKLEKTASQTVADTASSDLKKALEVSDVLREVTNLQGLHVDNALEALQKSIQDGAERDFAVIRVLQSMQKSIQDLGAKIEEYGKLPAPKTVGPVTTTKEQVLQKNAGTGQAGDEKKGPTKGQVLVVLEKMAKSAPSEGEASKYTNALVKFDSTGQISDQMLFEVQQELKKVAA